MDAAQEGRGTVEQNKSEVGSLRNEPQLVLIYYWLQTIFTFIGYIIQLFSLDKISTIIHFGLAALIFSVLYFTSRAPRSLCYYYIRLLQTADHTDDTSNSVMDIRAPSILTCPST